MENFFVNKFFLTAAEVNAQLEMPMGGLVTTIIDTATAHANALNVGYSKLMETNSSWVLSRLSITLNGVPTVNHNYELTTWVENLNRLYSERDFRLDSADDGSTLGWVNSVWMAIDMDTRRPVDLTALNQLREVVNDEPFLGEKVGKLMPFKDAVSSYDYQFRVSDIDVNRHVTTRRYIDLLMDLWPLEHFEEYRVSRFEIAFKHEAHYGEIATIEMAEPQDDGSCEAQLRVGDAVCAIARISFEKR